MSNILLANITWNPFGWTELIEEEVQVILNEEIIHYKYGTVSGVNTKRE